MKLASLHIICEYKKRAVAPGIRPSTSTLHYTLTTYGEKFLRTVENESNTLPFCPDRAVGPLPDADGEPHVAISQRMVRERY